MKINLNDRRCRPDGEWAPHEVTYVYKEELTSVDLDTLRPGDHLVNYGDLTPCDIDLLKFVVPENRAKAPLPNASDNETWTGVIRDAPTRLTRNAAQCRKCGDVIESKSVHDFVWCKCKSIYVDGGLDYCRRGGDIDAIIDLSEHEDEKEAA